MQFSSLHAYVKSNDVGWVTKLQRALSTGKTFSQEEVNTIVALHKAERPDSDYYLKERGKVLIVSDNKKTPFTLPHCGMRPDNETMVLPWTEKHGYASVCRNTNDEVDDLVKSALALANA